MRVVGLVAARGHGGRPLRGAQAAPDPGAVQHLGRQQQPTVHPTGGEVVAVHPLRVGQGPGAQASGKPLLQFLGRSQQHQPGQRGAEQQRLQAALVPQEAHERDQRGQQPAARKGQQQRRHHEGQRAQGQDPPAPAARVAGHEQQRPAQQGQQQPELIGVHAPRGHELTVARQFGQAAGVLGHGPEHGQGRRHGRQGQHGDEALRALAVPHGIGQQEGEGEEVQHWLHEAVYQVGGRMELTLRIHHRRVVAHPLPNMRPGHHHADGCGKREAQPQRCRQGHHGHRGNARTRRAEAPAPGHKTQPTGQHQVVRGIEPAHRRQHGQHRQHQGQQHHPHAVVTQDEGQRRQHGQAQQHQGRGRQPQGRPGCQGHRPHHQAPAQSLSRAAALLHLDHPKPTLPAASGSSAPGVACACERHSTSRKAQVATSPCSVAAAT